MGIFLCGISEKKTREIHGEIIGVFPEAVREALSAKPWAIFKWIPGDITAGTTE